MLSLRELQLRFAASLLDPAGAYAAPYVIENGIDAVTRIGFYRNNVVSNFRDAMRSTYRVVDRLVGEAYFNRLADAFFRAYPSHSGDLNRYGGEFPEFLVGHEASRQLEYLPDVAQLEWAIEVCFYAEHRLHFDLSALESVPSELQERIALELAPACRLLSSPFPIHRIWNVNQPAFQGDDVVDLNEGGVFLLVHRDRFEVALEPLSAGAYCLLLRLSAHATLADALAQAVALEPEFDAVSFLQRHAQLGTFTDVRLPVDETVNGA